MGLDGADFLPVTDLADDVRWGRLPDLAGPGAQGPGLKEVSVGRLWGFPSSMDWFKGKSTGNHSFYHQIDRAFL